MLIPDLAGFGASERPDGDLYMAAQADHLARFLRALGVDELLLGVHDFGGPVELRLLRRMPEPRAGALVVSATNPFTDTYVPPPLRLAGVPVLGDPFFRLAAGGRPGLRPTYRLASRRGLRAPAEHLSPSGIDLTRRIFQRSLADLAGAYGPIEHLSPELDLPTLVLWGDRDPFFPVAVGQRTAAAIPGGPAARPPRHRAPRSGGAAGGGGGGDGRAPRGAPRVPLRPAVGRSPSLPATS